ncbi:MAG TPA: DUF3048 domain-containing protein [Egibacteraceae bacterium]|nr:DUF3048 domain-containing protein [Egibacteraceae bacterium]
MRRLICAAALLGLLAAACSGSEPEAEPVATQSPAVSPTESPTPTPTPTPTPDTAPLTGLPVDDPAVLERPVLAAKIDNAPKARPQVGLEVADVVIEELVEGGTTRFIALYHSVDPGQIGPVRSGREVDANLLPAFQPVLAISGAAAPVNRDFANAGLLVLSYDAGHPAFSNDPGRPRPHHVIGSTEALWAAAPDLPPAALAWPFDAAAQPGGEEALEVALRFSPAASATWTWDASRREWLRAQGAEPHMTASGEQIAASTVIVPKIVVTQGTRVDSAGNPTANLQVVGDGEALILRDGQVFEARWSKAAPGEQFQWLTPSGAAFPLAPGRSWIELLPVSGQVDVLGPGTPAASASEG